MTTDLDPIVQQLRREDALDVILQLFRGETVRVRITASHDRVIAIGTVGAEATARSQAAAAKRYMAMSGPT